MKLFGRKNKEKMPEELRKEIYAYFMETKDSELLLESDLMSDFRGIMQGVAQGNFGGGLGGMEQSLKKNANKARVEAIKKTISKYNIKENQLLSIEADGKKLEWPFNSVNR